MKLDELKSIVEEGVKKRELKNICRIRTYYPLDKQIFLATKKGASDFEYLIMLPIIDVAGERWNGIGDLYGKPINL